MKHLYYSILVLGSFLASMVSPLYVQAAAPDGSLIKNPTNPAVYYIHAGKRYAFPNEATFKTWYIDFSSVLTVSETELASYALSGNVTYRPGKRLVKITTDPKVYAVSRYGVLRWMASESVAIQLYGSDWNKKVNDIPDTFFINYTVGSAINTSSDYTVNAELSVVSFSDNIKSAANTPPVTIAPAPVVESWSSLESRYFVEATAKGWTTLVITNLLGEKRYYRKEGTLWMQKSTEAEILQPYVEPPTVSQLTNLRLFCTIDATINAICEQTTLYSDYNNNVSFRNAIDGIIADAYYTITQNQRQTMAQQETVYSCLLKPLSPELSVLSPQQQTYLREQECGTATPSSKLTFKLYQQQEYQECLMNNLTSALPVSCEYLKPIFY